MRIGIFHSRLVHYGGLETRLLNYLNYFSQREDQVTLFVSKIDKAIALPSNVTLVRIRAGFIPHRFRLWYMNVLIRKRMRHVYFDFALSFGRIENPWSVIAPASHLGYLRALKKEGTRLKDRIQISLERRAFETASAIYACSHMVKGELTGLYHIPETKIRVLYPPLDTSRFHYSLKKKQSSLKEKYGLNPAKKSLFFISASHKRKGLPLLMEIFRGLDPDQFELIVAGRPVLQTDIPNISFLGYIRDTHELYAAADLTIHPAVYEPFGQIISESLACGTPVIVSEKVGAREIITKDEGMVVSGWDPGEWRSHILKAAGMDFNISPEWPEEKQLTLKHHMEKMMDFFFKTGNV